MTQNYRAILGTFSREINNISSIRLHQDNCEYLSVSKNITLLSKQIVKVYRRSICTDLAFISFPRHEATLCVNVPDKDVSSIGGGKQKGVHVVAQSRLLHITHHHWCFRLLDLQK